MSRGYWPRLKSKILSKFIMIHVRIKFLFLEFDGSEKSKGLQKYILHVVIRVRFKNLGYILRYDMMIYCDACEIIFQSDNLLRKQ